MNEPTSPYRALREAIGGLSQRAVERELGWRTGQLSLIERGLIPTHEERQALLRFYNAKFSEAIKEPA